MHDALFRFFFLNIRKPYFIFVSLYNYGLVYNMKYQLNTKKFAELDAVWKGSTGVKTFTKTEELPLSQKCLAVFCTEKSEYALTPHSFWCPCLIMGHGSPRGPSGSDSPGPLRFQRRAFLADCSVAVKTTKQLQQQTLEAMGQSQLTCG